MMTHVSIHVHVDVIIARKDNYLTIYKKDCIEKNNNQCAQMKLKTNIHVHVNAPSRTKHNHNVITNSEIK